MLYDIRLYYVILYFIILYYITLYYLLLCNIGCAAEDGRPRRGAPGRALGGPPNIYIYI